MVRAFKTRWLARFARRARISDTALAEALRRAESGLVDADLGGGLIKQRVAREGQGRSGGYRMILAYQSRRSAVFLYGFGKNDRENIQADELADLKIIGANWLNASPGVITRAIADGALEEIDLK